MLLDCRIIRECRIYAKQYPPGKEVLALRVISGSAKGRRLKTLVGNHTRPTSDRVRESLFNILGQDLCGIRFMDLFAGSGAVGVEALSRGASICVFVDAYVEACRVIRANLMATRLYTNAEVHCREVISAIEIAARKGRLFDCVFMDPPYDKGLLRRALERVSEGRILSEDAVVVVEHSKREPLPAVQGVCHRFRIQAYGDTMLSFYERARLNETPEETR
jgi:16S rRNA (guanine(966)-N(2))-methyltransferase RsmD